MNSANEDIITTPTKKVIIFGEFINLSSDRIFLKSSSVMRLAYRLRQNGYEVKQIHHCTSFKYEELKTIIEDFAKSDPVIVCVSTSFITSLNSNKTVDIDLVNKDLKYTSPFWGDVSFLFLINIGRICKEKNIPYILGGWEIFENKIINQYYQWKFNILKEFVTYFVVGKDVDIINKLSNNEHIEYEDIKGCKVYKSIEIDDFSDFSSTPSIEDNIRQGESLITEIAAGCIFSCSFCNYAALGKKKTEYLRSYESLEKEIISNYNNFGTTLYTFTDNIINDYPEKLKYLIRIREKLGIDIRWVGYARIDTMKNKEQVKLLLDSGMIGVSFGIESLNKETGRYIGKMTDKSRLIDSLGIFRDVVGDSVLVSGLFISGLPLETKENLYKTYEWLISTEGRYYIDSFIFTTLFLDIVNNDKNDINKSRNNPYKDYNLISKYNWVSPWGTRKEFSDLTQFFNKNKKNPHVTCFSLPYYSNIDYNIFDLIQGVRDAGKTGQSFILENHPVTHADYINQYKKEILSKIV